MEQQQQVEQAERLALPRTPRRSTDQRCSSRTDRSLVAYTAEAVEVTVVAEVPSGDTVEAAAALLQCSEGVVEGYVVDSETKQKASGRYCFCPSSTEVEPFA